MLQVKARIRSNERVAEGRFRIRLEAPSIARGARPGQFVMVKCSDGLDPLLRRPFSFHRIEKKDFELLYHVIGKGTEVLSQRKKGENLDIIGPLGNGFDILSASRKAGSRLAGKRYPRLRQGFGGQALNAILVAGGIGVAPLLALAEKISRRENKTMARREKIKILIGAKTKSHILCVDDFEKLGVTVEVATEDGSRGYKGLVTDLLACHCEALTQSVKAEAISKKGLLRRPACLDLLSAGGTPRNDSANANIYACGPRGMLKEVAALAKKSKMVCQVSLEENMACGTGVCLGCAVKTVTGFKMVCKDGPIFNSGEIIW